VNLEHGTLNILAEAWNPEPETNCYVEYDHKLGFLFKRKPAFSIPLNPLAFQYKDRLFTLSVRPVGGVLYDK